MSDPNLYESMAKHPDIAPVMEMLETVEPVDEFSKAICLIRDCFSPNNTLRALSRRQLRGLMRTRIALMTGFETAVVQAAREAGAKPKGFEDAMKALPPEVFERMHASYRAQVDELMGRPLERGD